MNENALVKERILVVDDQSTHRQKMKLAVEVLGYEATTASDGQDALSLLKKSDFDLVLLDILMPGMDGFAVMEFMQRDPTLRDIPVIVISALDSEMESVVRAIEFGAKDFLPKNYDSILLKTRINTSLEAKRHRDKELAYFKKIERLTDAAAILEKRHVNPNSLKLDELSTSDDALGQLVRVFNTMAQQVYERENRLQQQIRTLRGIGLLMAVGCLAGLSIPLSRIAASQSDHAIGIALWVNVFCAAICLPIALYRGKLPQLTSQNIVLFLAWGILGTLFGQVILLKVAAHLEASLIAIIVVAEGFLVFAFAAALRIEKANLKRLFGFLIGLAGLVLVVTTVQGVQGSNNWLWAILACVVPLSYAFRALLISVKLPADMDLFGAVGFSAVAAVIVILPVGLYTDDLIPLSIDGADGTTILLFAIILLATISATATALKTSLIKTTGAVFASQSSLVTTLAGIGWSMLLLGENLPLAGWTALLLMLLGAHLVGLKEEADATDPFFKVDHEL